MNNTIQTILVIITSFSALIFLVRKFIWKPKTKTTKGCGTGNCGCD